MQKGNKALIVTAYTAYAACALLLAGCRQQPPASSQPAVQATEPKVLTIGGKEVLTLARKASNNGSKPEFLSVTLLPGRGMNMFQVTATIPGKGEIPLMYSPSLEDAAKQLSGTGKISWATRRSVSVEPF